MTRNNDSDDSRTQSFDSLSAGKGAASSNGQPPPDVISQDEPAREAPEEVDTVLGTHTHNSLDSLGISCSEVDESRIRELVSSSLAESVTEKRDYDFLVNKLNRRLAEVTATKNKCRNECTEMQFAARKMLDEIKSIERGDQSSIAAGSVVGVKGIRGPPLLSQNELFMNAYKNGQVKSTYSKFSQRGYSKW
jgi:hypothetical protein